MTLLHCASISEEHYKGRFPQKMASNLAAITLRTARYSFQKSINTSGPLLATRAGSSTPLPPLSETIKNAQGQFQVADDTPVFKKGGTFDGILYRFTMGLCVTSLSLIGMNIVMMAMKK